MLWRETSKLASVRKRGRKGQSLFNQPFFFWLSLVLQQHPSVMGPFFSFFHSQEIYINKKGSNVLTVGQGLRLKYGMGKDTSQVWQEVKHYIFSMNCNFLQICDIFFVCVSSFVRGFLQIKNIFSEKPLMGKIKSRLLCFRDWLADSNEPRNCKQVFLAMGLAKEKLLWVPIGSPLPKNQASRFPLIQVISVPGYTMQLFPI